MNNNYYNNLAKIPAMKAKYMPDGLEDLALALVESGRFRVDTLIEQNFVRWGRPSEGINMMFSHREVFNHNLIPRTMEAMKKVLARRYSGEILIKKIRDELERMQNEAKKNIDVHPETEMVLARLIVQSAEPPVIMLLIAEGAEVFVSYSYSVGDMLDIQTWKEAGNSSGLQATDRMGCAVFVSCGGNPIAKKPTPERPYDGFEALSRMLVIAGQELAHYSDIIREGNYKGSRFSADLYYGRASEVARKGRLADIKNTLAVQRIIENIGLRRIAEAERQLKFFMEHRKWSFVTLRSKLKVLIYQIWFILSCKLKGYEFLESFYKEKYMCTKIAIMFSDMLFNLQPEADAYKRPDPIEEEMIMCIEALARVQQQANKWGIGITKIMYPNLYKLYYMQILPSCVSSVERLSGQKFPEIFGRQY